MGKTLRVCLAMGGGVSLGAFSGSALTEALKLLILYGCDEDKEPYDEVIVDGMSGASAGAIALTIMLKCLIDYKAMIPLFDEELDENILLQEIAKDYFNDKKNEASAHPKIEDLKALQLAQKIQNKLWTEEVDAVKLFKGKINSEEKDINSNFALLDRGLLEKLTKDYLMYGENFSIENRRVLAKDRIVFACSLTNLLPIELSSKYDELTRLEKNVKNSVGSQNHTELRVIDFVFDERSQIDKPTDKRWLKFSKHPDPEKPEQFNLLEKNAWATISASALACGAFPIAFEPVLLKRYASEYGLVNDKKSSWPQPFKNIIKEIKEAQQEDGKIFNNNAFIGFDTNEKLDYSSFNFPYIDGGTFNNEPIREAFKIGSFQDFDRDEVKNEERLILFVDPIVRQDDHHSFKIEALKPVKLKDNKKVSEIVPKKEFSKLTGSISNILGALVNQGNIKEEHKINDVKENLILRSTVFPYLENNNDLGRNLSVELLATAFNKIDKNLKNGMISLGTRNPLVYFLREITKTCTDGNKNSKCLLINGTILKEVKTEVERQIDDLENKIISKTDIELIYNIIGIASNVYDQLLFARTVFKVIIDFALNLEGKSSTSFRAAIMPIDKNLSTVSLPGGEIAAFGGFASLKARKYSFEFAKLSALFSLKQDEDGFRKNKPFIISDNFSSLEGNYEANIVNSNFFVNDYDYGQELKDNLFKKAIERVKVLFNDKKLMLFLLTKVPFSITGLGAVPFLLFKNIKNSLPWRGNQYLNSIIKKGGDRVKYIALESVLLSIVSDSKFSNRATVILNDQRKEKKFKMHIEPIHENGKKRYRYYLQFYKLEYLENKNKALSSEISTKNNVFKFSSVDRMALTIDNRVIIPSNIDGNLFPEKKNEALIANYKHIIEKIKIKGYELDGINNDINDKQSSLFYCLKNSNSHINPVIEIDLQKKDEGWYFKEQTKSLDKKLIEE